MRFRCASQPGIMQTGAKRCLPGTPNVSAESFYGFPSQVLDIGHAERAEIF
jgi:hypothetical protein